MNRTFAYSRIHVAGAGASRAEPESASASAASVRDTLGFRLVALLWVLYLFAPHKLLQFYSGIFRPITWIVEILLIGGIVLKLTTRSGERQIWRGYPAFTLFFVLSIVGYGMAMVYGSTERTADTLRELYQYYLLGLLTFAYCSAPRRAMTILAIYVGHIAYFGLWGVWSLVHSPLEPGMDPGARDIIYWHIHYGNRDAFGPLMVIGMAMALYFAQATPKARSFGWATVGLSLVGIFTSFGRGVFLSLIATGALMWLRAKRKARILMIVGTAVVVLPAVIPGLAQRYADSMGTIVSEGTHKGTGADRSILGWAFRVFKLNPVTGVGPSNFGIAVFDVVPEREWSQNDYTFKRLYGRRLHSIPMTVLSEYGIVGVLAFVFLIIDFFVTNAATQRIASADSPDGRGALPSAFPPGYLAIMARALQIAFVGILINGVFYELLYLPILWNLITLNRMMYFASNASARVRATAAQTAWWTSKQALLPRMQSITS